MRILAIDYGQKRLGIAISDALGITATPYPFVPHDKQVFDRLNTLIQEHSIGEIVVGLPITLKGTASAMTEETQKFADTLKAKISIPVVLQDERFSTMESEKILIQADVSREKRKEVRDSMAASIILQDYLERRSS